MTVHQTHAPTFLAKFGFCTLHSSPWKCFNCLSVTGTNSRQALMIARTEYDRPLAAAATAAASAARVLVRRVCLFCQCVSPVCVCVCGPSLALGVVYTKYYLRPVVIITIYILLTTEPLELFRHGLFFCLRFNSCSHESYVVQGVSPTSPFIVNMMTLFPKTKE